MKKKVVKKEKQRKRKGASISTIVLVWEFSYIPPSATGGIPCMQQKRLQVM